MRDVLTGLVKRRLADVATARFAEEPVLVLNGPRAVGKSTLLSQLAERPGRTVIDGVPETFVARVLEGSGIEMPSSRMSATTRDP